jgi:hypothetical protein
VSEGEIQELHRRLDDMTEAMHQMAKANVQLATQFAEACRRVDRHEVLTQAHQDEITTLKGQVSVGRWVLMTVGGALIVSLVGGIWAIAVRI